MARLDIKTVRNARKLRVLQCVEYASALRRYHYLKSFYDAGLTTRENRALFVESYPYDAAKLFYHRDDRVLGGLLVRAYRQHPQSELRVLAEVVRGVLRARQERDERPETVLGMLVVPLIDEQDAEEELYVQEAYREYAERTLEHLE